MTALDEPAAAGRLASYGAVVAVLDAGGTPCGAGFLAADSDVVTCAHVVTAAGGSPGGRVRLSFPHLPGGPLVSARVDPDRWRPDDEQDVAVLRLDESPPGVSALPLGSAAGCRGHRVSAFGFPDGAPGGRFGYGRAGDVLPADGRGRLLQLAGANDVARGFSGAPVIDEVTGLVLGMVTSIAPVDQEQRGAGIAYATATETLRAVHPDLAETAVCPYRGLAPFAAEHRAWFHGRDEVVRRVHAALRHRAVLLLGPSGSGKSSLMHAGVLPAAGDTGRVLAVRPGPDLLAALERAGLAGAAGGDLVAAVRRHAGGGRLLIVVDQFEELFVEARRGGRVLDPLAQLENAIRDVPALSVVLVLRDDFYPQLAAAAPGLLDPLAAGLVNVPATLAPDALTAIITRPAASVGLRFEPGLADQIVADLEAAGPDAPVAVLPLLELTLLQLWERRSDGRLTHEGYRSIGRVTGGLTASCDQAVADLPAAHRPIARRMLTALVRPADPERHIPAVRRRVPLADLRELASGHAGHEPGAVDAVLRALTTTTPLIVTYVPAGHSAPVAELVHDALIRDWQALRGWVGQDSRFHEWLRRAEERQQRWAGTSDPADLLHGSDLAEGVEWSGQRRLPAPIGALLAASRGAAHARVRRTRMVAAVMAVLFVLGSTAAVFAFTQRQTAVGAQRTALSRQLAAQSQIQAPGNPDLSALLAVHAYRTSPTREALTSLHAAASALHPLRQTLTGHTSVVRSVAFSRDGRLLATAGRDQTVRLWDAATGRPGRTLVARTDLWAVRLSPDGRTVATAGDDRTVRLWDVATGRTRATLAGHTAAVHAVAFRPDGRLLASADADAVVRLWDPATGRTTATLTGHTDTVNAVVFSPDGRSLATASGDATVRLWDVATGRSRRTLSLRRFAVTAVAFSPDGKTLASASGDGTVRLWEAATGRARTTLAGHTDTVNTVAFSPDGSTVATAGDDRTVRLWDAAIGAGKATLTRHSAAVNAVAFSPDGRTLATAGDDTAVRLWDLAAGTGKATLTGHADVWAVRFSPDGRTLATAGGDNRVRLWDVATGRTRATLTGHTDTVDTVAFSPDGTVLASAGRDETVRLWDVATGRSRRTIAGRADVWSVAFSPDGRLLAGAGGDDRVRLWEVATGRRTATLTGHTDTVTSVAFSPDGGTLASAGSDATARLWEVETGTVETVLTVNGYAVTAVAFSPDGRTLATAGSDATVRLWDLATDRTTAVLTVNSYAVNTVAFSPDGRTLASAGDDRTARLWDVAAGTSRATLTGHTDAVVSVAFSPDGRTLATASGDHTARLWAFALPDPATAVRQICSAVGHEISPEEHAQYLPGQPVTPACP